jgi:hypothetical protein
MNIVATSYFLRYLRTLDFFTLNLGQTRKLVNQKESIETIRKLSEFEIKYNNIYNRSINKFGSIGKITFYEDLRASRYKYLIFKGDDIYEIEWSEEDMKDVKNYILETLRKIDDLEKEPSDEEIREKQQLVDSESTWVATDDKNKGKRYKINQTLSREQYREQLLNLKRK